MKFLFRDKKSIGRITMSTYRVIILILFCAFIGQPLQAGNPLNSGVGTTFCDPHGLVFNDRVYLFTTDDFSPTNNDFVMKDWRMWSSADLVTWKLESTLKPEDTFLKRSFKDCWATFGATRHGKYYWYFSAGPEEVGVVVSDSPAGPWKDPLGKPLLARGLTPTEQRDPDIFRDDDGQAYMVYGTFKYFLVRLNDDMISLAETPHRVQLDREFGPYGEGKTDDKPSLHKRNGVYYLSWSSFYAMSTNLYGPYTYKGSVIAAEKVAPEFQIDKTAHVYDQWHDRHGNFFTWHNQWYYVCNDKSQPGRTDFYRDSIMAYVHYKDNGEMAPVRIDRIGVGEYDASQPRIEAEDYFNATGVEQRECPDGGFEVRGLRKGSNLFFPKVKNLQPAMRLSLRAASGNPKGATVEIREKTPTGKILGICKIPPTGGWDQYQTIDCQLKTDAAVTDLCLVLKGGSGELVRLDWFSLQCAGIGHAN